MVLILKILLFGFITIPTAHAQFYNKEVKAEVLVEKNSEFTTFKATAENLTPSDYSLQYDFMVFKTDANNNTTKRRSDNNTTKGAAR